MHYAKTVQDMHLAYIEVDSEYGVQADGVKICIERYWEVVGGLSIGRPITPDPIITIRIMFYSTPK